MKKSIIALMGLFTLVACSEDIYDEAEKQNEESGSQYQTNSFNDGAPGFAHGDSGISGPIWAGDRYASPWDFRYREVQMKQPNYIVINGNAEFTSPFNLRIKALAGLAYFDGVNDGIFNDLFKPGTSFNLAGGSYPNLFAGGQEAGNLVYNTNALNANAYPAGNSSFRIESRIDHLPTNPNPTPAHPTLPNNNLGFNFSNLTAAEQSLLLQYGKVFFYEVQVFDKVTNALVFTTLIHPENETLPTGPIPNANWQPVTDMLGNQLQGNVPGWANLDLFYYNANIGGTVWNGPMAGGKCDSREIMFDVPHSMKMWERPIGSTGYKLSLTILQNSSWLWQNSSLYLTVTM